MRGRGGRGWGESKVREGGGESKVREGGGEEGGGGERVR